MIPKEMFKVAKKVRFLVSERIASKYDEFDPKTMACACAITSYVLHEALTEKGINTTFVAGHYDGCGDHCWIEYRGHIIDPTATQFNSRLPKIFTTHAKNEKYISFQKGNKALHYVKHTWYRVQSPIKYKKEIKSILKEIKQLMV